MSIPADQLFPGFKTPPNAGAPPQTTPKPEVVLQDYFEPEYEDAFERCDMCGGDGVIEYLEGGPSVWQEDCPSLKNHLLTCSECRGRGA